MAFFFTSNSIQASPTSSHFPEATIYPTSFHELLDISPHEYTNKTGKKLNFTQVIKLKLTQNYIKRAVLKSINLDDEPKSQIITLLLCIIVGFLGIHRFYLGYTSIGIIQALTFGGCLVWWIVDIILVLSGNLGPADGSEYYPKFEDV